MENSTSRAVVVAFPELGLSAYTCDDLFHQRALLEGCESALAAVAEATTKLGVVAIVGGILANGQNVAFLVALAFAVAASANLPTLLYSLFWKKFNTTGALFSIYGGLSICILLILFSPVVSGSATAIFGESVDFAFFPLQNPGIVSIPLSFLLGVIIGGSLVAFVAPSASLAFGLLIIVAVGVGSHVVSRDETIWSPPR